MPGATHHRDQIATHRHLGQTQLTSFANRLLVVAEELRDGLEALAHPGASALPSVGSTASVA
jgi:hypothetical protein